MTISSSGATYLDATRVDQSRLQAVSLARSSLLRRRLTAPDRPAAAQGAIALQPSVRNCSYGLAMT